MKEAVRQVWFWMHRSSGLENVPHQTNVPDVVLPLTSSKKRDNSSPAAPSKENLLVQIPTVEDGQNPALYEQCGTFVLWQA